MRFFHLSTCSTCQRILKELNLPATAELQDIKKEPITEAQLDRMAQLMGSYESLFSRRAMQYRAMGLHEKTLSEDDYKRLILEEYTFLKRPVLLSEKQIFVGNNKNTVAKAAHWLAQL